MTAVRRNHLIRLGTWIGLATAAVLAVFIAARTETGVRRIATLISSEPPAAMRGARDPQVAGRSFDQEAEQRRLSDAIRSLAADRDRLLARVNTLEHSLEDVTGSIPGSTPRAASPLPPSMTPMPPAAQTPAPNAGAAGPNRVAAGHLATGSPGASESIATKTEFGVDLGGNASIEGLRTLWNTLKSNQPGLLEGLRPVISIREGQKGVELRLVAGPIVNASLAARLCGALAAVGQACQPAVFDGQRLALQ